MDRCRKSGQSLNLNEKEDELGVIDMSQVVTDIQPLGPKETEKLVTRRPKDAQDLRKMIGTRTVGGKNLVDIYKEEK
ncbi:hypothetical protein MN033_03480 [Bacillus nitratireducens]|uniref:hypothetical protein n=1 Tax=Bacillus nitratireducens TaxID=2026193 RepID=UPI001F58E814|nr:hypothetical protein [Bacillus nitratireducens]UNP77266.1 hypothetical protein MN033_03480 [Bacillus nitratireducens]